MKKESFHDHVDDYFKMWVDCLELI